MDNTTKKRFCQGVFSIFFYIFFFAKLLFSTFSTVGVDADAHRRQSFGLQKGQLRREKPNCGFSLPLLDCGFLLAFCQGSIKKFLLFSLLKSPVLPSAAPDFFFICSGEFFSLPPLTKKFSRSPISILGTLYLSKGEQAISSLKM